MKTELKDVLHLMVGQEVLHDWFGEKSIEKIIAVFESTVIFEIYDDQIEDQYDLLDPDNTDKLILRPLSDMTDEEGRYCAILLWHNSDEEFEDKANIYKERQINRAKLDIRDYFGMISLPAYRIGFQLFAYLLKQGFDLFGLIKSGQAIDRKTLNL
jgi:hypothetical protein